jgi:hypothetical protein
LQAANQLENGGRAKKDNEFHFSHTDPQIVHLIFLSLPFTLRGETNRDIPGSKDVPSAKIEGDPYLAANRFPDEG